MLIHGRLTSLAAEPIVVDSLDWESHGAASGGGGILTEMATHRSDAGWRMATLTPFEHRVLELFASGSPRSEIARMLHRAPKTISNSLTVAKDKLGARSLTEAAVLIAAEAIVLTSRVGT